VKTCHELQEIFFSHKINDKEIPKLIEFAKSLGVEIGIQNFLEYRHGKKPAKQMPWSEFYRRIKVFEKHFGIRLLYSPDDFNIQKTKELPKPFKKGDLIRAKIACPGAFEKEKVAVLRGRSISVPNCTRQGSVRITITRSKHNIYYGILK